MAALNHRALLTLYCRICGQITIPNNANNSLHPVDDFASLLQMLHEVRVKEESPDMFPKSVCDNCCKRYSVSGSGSGSRGDELFFKVEAAHLNMASDPDAVKKLAREHPLADFWAHSSMGCQICDNEYSHEPARLLDMVQQVSRFHKRPAMAVGSSRPKMGGGAGSSPANELQHKVMTARVVKCLQGKQPKYRAQMIANLLREDTRQSSRIVEELGKYGVTFQDDGGKQATVTSQIRADTQVLHTEMSALAPEMKILALIKFFASEVKSGRLQIMADTGIIVDVLHSNFAPVLRKKMQNAQVINVGGPVVAKKSAPGAAAASPSSSLTITKAAGGRPNGTPARKKRPIDLTEGDDSDDDWKPEKGERGAGSVAKRRRGGPVGRARGRSRPMAAASQQRNNGVEAQSGGLVIMGGSPRRASPEELDKMKKMIHGMLPTNRVMRADIVRYLLLSARKDKRNLLKRVGITFDPDAGYYLCERGFSLPGAKVYEVKLAKLIDVQWAVIMAEVVFKLAHPKDNWMLAQIGITIDPTNQKAPIALRLQHEMKQYIINSYKKYNDTASSLCHHLVKTFDLKAIPLHIRAVEALLGCENKEATAFINHGAKAPPKAKAVPAAATAPGPVSRKAPKGYAYVVEEVVAPLPGPRRRGGKPKKGYAYVAEDEAEDYLPLKKRNLAKKAIMPSIRAKGRKGRAAKSRRVMTPSPTPTPSPPPSPPPRSRGKPKPKSKKAARPQVLRKPPQKRKRTTKKNRLSAADNRLLRDNGMIDCRLLMPSVTEISKNTTGRPLTGKGRPRRYEGPDDDFIVRYEDPVRVVTFDHGGAMDFESPSGYDPLAMATACITDDLPDSTEWDEDGAPVVQEVDHVIPDNTADNERITANIKQEMTETESAFNSIMSQQSNDSHIVLKGERQEDIGETFDALSGAAEVVVDAPAVTGEPAPEGDPVEAANAPENAPAGATDAPENAPERATDAPENAHAGATDAPENASERAPDAPENAPAGATDAPEASAAPESVPVNESAEVTDAPEAPTVESAAPESVSVNESAEVSDAPEAHTVESAAPGSVPVDESAEVTDAAEAVPEAGPEPVEATSMPLLDEEGTDGAAVQSEEQNGAQTNGEVVENNGSSAPNNEEAPMETDSATEVSNSEATADMVKSTSMPEVETAQETQNAS